MITKLMQTGSNAATYSLLPMHGSAFGICVDGTGMATGMSGRVFATQTRPRVEAKFAASPAKGPHAWSPPC